ncbi:MAG: glycoside hydrolase family 38 C-terminal domain-containing protein [Armatimonadota bacterium]|nr:glycosyl hydrolase-related protein [bacterium]
MKYKNQDGLSEGINRLKLQLRFAEAILEMYPDSECSAEVKSAKDIIRTREAGLSADTIESFVSECEGMLRKTSALAKTITVHCVAHAHIDMNWQWAFDETVAVTQDTFSTMLKLMDRYPDFTFSQSQASVYKIIEKYNPQMLEQIKRRVQEGRWEVSSSTWVEGDKNMASGESQIRQVFYTKRYFKELFDLDYDDIRLDFEPDTFGHSINVPAILSRVGVKNYYHCRAFNGPKLYRWISPDGSSIICYHEKSDWYNYGISSESVLNSVLTELRETGVRDVLRVYGVGDHGGGPTVRDIQSILKISDWPVFPTIKFSTYSEYFSGVEASGVELPEDKSEHNYVFTGCYTSQSEIKKANRQGEKNLAEAEAFSCIADRISSNFSYPSVNIAEAWEKLLFSQFHDILPGSGVRETREYSMGKYQEIIAATSSAKKSALSAITDSIDTSTLPEIAGIKSSDCHDWALGAGVGFWQELKGMSCSSIDDSPCRIFTVFNPSPFERSEIVETVLWDMKGEGRITVKDKDNNHIEHQVIEYNATYCGHAFQTILFEAENIPPLGYKCFIVYKDQSKAADCITPWQARIEEPFNGILENEFLRAELDVVSGAVKSLVIKDGDIELVPEGQATGLFRIIDEVSRFGGGMSAWLIGTHSYAEPVTGVGFNSYIITPDQSAGLEQSSFRTVNGPLRNGIVWTASVRSSKLIVGIYLEKGSKNLRIDCKCDWLDEDHTNRSVPQLNITFPVAIKDSRRVFEVPFGVVERSVDNADVPTLRWADISGTSKNTGEKVGLTVATDCKYGFRGSESELSVSLIRSSYDPDPHPEFGEHRFSITAIPHKGNCDFGSAFKESIAFDQPLQVFQTTAHDGHLPLSSSFIEIKNTNLVLSAMKKQDDGNGIILRLYEIEGKSTEAEIKVSPFLLGEEVVATEVDAMERRMGRPVASESGIVRHHVPAYGIVTLLIEGKGV